MNEFANEMFKMSAYVTLESPTKKKGDRFCPGRIYATEAVLNAFEDAKEKPLDYLARHVQGDFGSQGQWTDKDGDVPSRGIILSSYRLGEGTEVLIATESDRSTTTILLPSEYD